MSKKLVCAVALTALTSGCTASNDAASSEADITQAPPSEVLALGDSVTFAWDPRIESDLALVDARKYRGYADMVAERLGVGLTNTACPGEASDGFLRPDGADNGCRPNRAQYKLHTDWKGADTQAAFVIPYLQSRVEAGKPPALVTMTLGGNDLGLLFKQCESHKLLNAACLALYFPFYEQAFRQNLEKIFLAIDGTGYRGKLVIIRQYALDYSDKMQTLAGGHFIGQIPSAIEHVQSKLHGLDVRVADGYGAFKAEADQHGGKSCEAGLVIPLPDGTCDSHPSKKGHELLAKAVLDAIQ